MKKSIFIIDTSSQDLKEVQATTFSSIGIKECADLQQWIVKHPSLLGEELLLLGNEFSSFTGSGRRVDMLALDKDGVLVVVELKLEMEGTHAELQAIRYASMCSTMTMDDAVAALARHRNCAKEEALATILAFLGVEELPELSNQPRVILAASSFGNPELTGAVLWLRGFGVNISCVELLPYKMPTGELFLAPRVLIPLPETESYQVKVERKEAAKARNVGMNSALAETIGEIAALYNTMYPADPVPVRATECLGIRTAVPYVLYRWHYLRKAGSLRIILVSESADRELNERRIKLIMQQKEAIERESNHEFEYMEWGDLTVACGFQVVVDREATSEVFKAKCAELMHILRTQSMHVLDSYGAGTPRNVRSPG